jgi:hypothetical protein
MQAIPPSQAVDTRRDMQPIPPSQQADTLRDRPRIPSSQAVDARRDMHPIPSGKSGDTPWGIVPMPQSQEVGPLRVGNPSLEGIHRPGKGYHSTGSGVSIEEGGGIDRYPLRMLKTAFADKCAEFRE